MSDNNKAISSAEMTATWRCDEPQYSYDRYSVKLVSTAGLKQAKDYQKTQYTLSNRHMSLRAGFIADSVCELVEKNHYDTVISLGSGLSLISYCIAEQLQAKHYNQPLTFIDSDLAYMIEQRVERIKQQRDALPITKANFRFANIVLDIEATFKSAQKENKYLHDYLPSDIKKPVFILEGIIYFLSDTCRDWLFESFQQFDNVAVVMDYLREDAPQQSAFFNDVLKYFKENLPENLQTLMPIATLTEYCQAYTSSQDLPLAEIEQDYVATDQCILKDINQYVPARLCVLEK